MKNLMKSVMIVLAIALMISCISLPALAVNQTNDEIVSDMGSIKNDTPDDTPEVARAPEYIRIRNTSGYNCYTTPGKTAAEGATIACQVKTGDYLLFMETKFDAIGRNWVKGQIQGSHPNYGWYVWLLYDNTYMSIGY